MTDLNTTGPFFVVVPVYNEAESIGATLDALAAQTDRDFTLVVVDNSSTDSSVEAACAFQAKHNDVKLELISEPLKGTGAASDSGFRHAIERGAEYIARTDASLERALRRRGLLRA